MKNTYKVDVKFELFKNLIRNGNESFGIKTRIKYHSPVAGNDHVTGRYVHVYNKLHNCSHYCCSTSRRA